MANEEFTSTGSSSISSNETAGTGTNPNLTDGSDYLKQDVYAAANSRKPTGAVPGTVLMDVLASIQSVIPDVINSVSNIVGFMTEI